MTGPKKLDRMARLGNRYGLVLPTATRVRKIGSTTVALNVWGRADATMIHRQLSHTPKTDELHYQAIVDHCKVCVVSWKQGFLWTQPATYDISMYQCAKLTLIRSPMATIYGHLVTYI